jgi:hypothetical protein
MKSGLANRNLFGKSFEENTNNERVLLTDGYEKCFFTDKNWYTSKKYTIKEVIFISQYNFKPFMKYRYNIQVFRIPDEAYIIEYTNKEIHLKIIEKKAQNTQGSVETKLWAGPSLKREYELLLQQKFKVSYVFCLNNFLKKKVTSLEQKYIILNKILEENEILILFGDDLDYFEKLNNLL